MEYFFKGEMSNTEDVQPVFDDLYSIISTFESLTSESKDHVCHTINSIQNHLIQLVHNDPHIPLTIRNIIKLFLYFYQNLYKRAEDFFDTHMSTGLMISKSASAGGSNDNAEDDDDDDTFASAVKPSTGKKTKAAALAKKGAKKPSSSNAVSSAFDWIKWRQVFLKANMEWVELEPMKLWSMGIIPEVVLGNIWEYSLYILEKRPLGTYLPSLLLHAVCCGTVAYVITSLFLFLLYNMYMYMYMYIFLQVRMRTMQRKSPCAHCAWTSWPKRQNSLATMRHRVHMCHWPPVSSTHSLPLSTWPRTPQRSARNAIISLYKISSTRLVSPISLRCLM